MSGRKFCLKEQKIYKCGISLRSRLQIEAQLMKLRVQKSAAGRVTQSHATFIDDDKSKVGVHVIASKLGRTARRLIGRPIERRFISHESCKILCR